VTVQDNGATTLSSTNAITCSLNGKTISHAAFSNHANVTSDVNTGAAFTRIGTSEGCVFVLGLASNGDLKVAQGSIEALDTGENFMNKAPQFPAIPDTMVPFAYSVVKAGDTAAAKATGWLWGTSNHTGVTGVACVVVDVCTLPDRPQVA
jgi:hypothetical protein